MDVINPQTHQRDRASSTHLSLGSGRGPSQDLKAAPSTTENPEPERDGLDFSEAVTTIVEAFGDPTRRAIYLFVREHDSLTAGEVATHFDLHPNVARHHLDKLTAGGYLDYSSERPTQATAGRPSKRYRSSRKVSLFDRERKQFSLLSMLLSKTLSFIPLPQAEKMAEEVGLEYGKNIASELPRGQLQGDIGSVMSFIADALTAHGFASKQDPNDQLKVVNTCCPFGTAAVDHPVLCAVERGMIRGMLASLFDENIAITVSSRARGDLNCSVIL
jgi:predicted ArsR family transcriptional regulator